MNYRISLCFLFLLTISFKSYSQTDYAVLTSGDTIQGKIKYSNAGNTTKKYIQVNTGNSKDTYTILQVRSFKLKDDIFHTVRYQQGYTFMKLLTAGYLNLYSYQPENQASWDGRFMAKMDGQQMDIPNLGFKKRMAEFLSDCDAVANKILSGELGKSDLDVITESYNTCKRVTAITTTNQITKISKKSWDDLEEAVKTLDSFESKKDALDMISEAKLKLSRNETIPSFIINGLKDSLKDQPTVKDLLEAALNDLK